MKVPMFIHDQNLLITVPADGLAPNGARPSAGTVITTYESNDTIQNGKTDLANLLTHSGLDISNCLMAWGKWNSQLGKWI